MNDDYLDNVPVIAYLRKAEQSKWPKPRSGWQAFKANLRLWWEQGWFPWHITR